MSEAVTDGSLSGASAGGISRELKDRFHEAVEMAADPGGQKYARDGVPQCVIGCYAAKYAPEAFKRAAEVEVGNLDPTAFPSYSVTYMVEAGVELVPKDVVEFARELQREWDRPLHGFTLDETRARLHAIVEAA